MNSQKISIDDPIQLVPSKLYRLGARIATCGRVSWAPYDMTEALPVNVYLRLTDDAAIVIDTGPLALYPSLAEQIAELTAGRDLRVLVTRNDPEAMGGVGTLLPQLDPSVLYYFGGGSILEWVWDERRGPKGSGDLFGIVPIATPGQIALEGGNSLIVLRPPLAVLNTVWLFDQETRTLFSSDAFTYVPGGAVEAITPAVSDSDAIDPARTYALLQARFDWLERINSSRLKNVLQDLLSTLPIGRIAPSHGVVMEGPAVPAYLTTMLAALEPRVASGHKKDF